MSRIERAQPWCPMSLRIDSMAAMLNAELSGHPVYDGVELQWFDDDVHGTGMLAFLSRRADRSVDYYRQRGLRLDPGTYEIGGGTRSWNEIDFAAARLEVADDGVVAQVRFVDVDGRLVEVDIDDRDGQPRRRAGLLAPVSSGIVHPKALLLVWMPGFDLVRMTPAHPPVIRVDGREVATGRLPGARLHRRHLIKYAAPLCSVELNRDGDPPTTEGGPGAAEPARDGSGVRALTATGGSHAAQVSFRPPFPDVRALDAGVAKDGRWSVDVDGTRLTGGTWALTTTDGVAHIAVDVTDRWRPRRLPWLMRTVTAVVPVFRRWPTTYAWRATASLDGPHVREAGWHRTGTHDGGAYRRATGS